jgi:ribosomal protein L37E
MEQLTGFGPRSKVQAFGCSHATCRACDDSLFRRADDRCPMCRAPRTEESRVSQTPAAQQQHNAALRAANPGNGPGFPTIFFATQVNPDTMDEDEQAELMVTLQRTLLSLHSRTLGEDADELPSGPPAEPGSRPPLQPIPLPVRDPAVRAVLHSLTEAALVPLDSFHRLAARVRASRRNLSGQASAAS